jgi:hypothetical protein
VAARLQRGGLGHPGHPPRAAADGAVAAVTFSPLLSVRLLLWRCGFRNARRDRKLTARKGSPSWWHRRSFRTHAELRHSRRHFPACFDRWERGQMFEQTASLAAVKSPDLTHHIRLHSHRRSAALACMTGVLLTRRRHVDLCRLASCVCP